jgi:hypothetical protein
LSDEHVTRRPAYGVLRWCETACRQMRSTVRAFAHQN